MGRDRLLELITLQDPKLAEGVERCEWVFENKLSHLNWTDGTPILERKFTNAELALLIDEPFEPSEQLTDYGLSIAQQRQLHVAKDPVVWARDMMGFKSRVYQTLILRHPSLRKVLRAGRRLGKALALDTPIPTEFGFKPMKDISVGDRVFDETGKLCNVTFISDIQSNRKCYNVKFSDGSVIKADAEHLWTVQTKRSRKARQRATNPVALEETLTTEELKQNLYVWCGDKYEVNYSIDVVSSPLEYPEKDLVIDPYVLGYWLGDGSSADGRIHTGDEDIILEFKKVGYEVRQSSAYEYTYQVHGLNTQLRSLNLIKNKHIPDDYMYASPDQRLALLQGLMDSDGHCTPNGTCEISQKNHGLANDIKKLVESLGIRASMRDDPAKLYGKDCGRRYRVGFTPWQEVFRLERKLANVRLQEHPSPRQISRYIVAIEETGSVDVKCIQVDSPKSLYLAGYECIPTHNTTSMAIMLLHYSWTTTNGKCIVVTPMKAQGGLIYEEILKWANKSPDVQEAIVRKVTSPQYEINFKNGSTIRFFSSGTKSGGKSDVTRGQEAHMIVLDEMDYMHPDDLVALYAMLQATDDNQPDKVLVGASTPTGRQEIFFDWCTDPSEGFREFYFPSYCFIPGQLVGMADGSYKQIEDIIEGDLVKTENGPQRVVRTFERDYDGDIVGITTYGHSDPVYSTPEHPFMAAQRNFKQNPSYRGKRVEANWDWVDAGDLSSVLRRNQNSGHFLRYILDKTVEQNDFIDMTQFALHQCMDRVMITPRSKNSLPTKVYLDESLATLAGWYLAEGSVDNNSIEWTLSKAEFHVAEEIQNALHKLSAGEARISTEERYNTLRVRITNGALVVLLSHLCGVGSKEKQMSREIMYADFGFQRDLLKHYARGDGWEFSPGDFDIRTTSKVLAMQLRDICSRLGQIPSISTSAPSSRDFGNGYGVYQTAKSYCINYRTNTTNMLGKRYDSEHAALLIKDIQRHKYTGKVYNFEVENTNTYTVNGLLVHNCNPKFTKEIEDELRKRYGEMGFRHEIEADWGEPSDGVYPRRFIDRAFSHKNWKYKPEAKTEPGTYHVIGVDWDKYKATPNIVILKVYTHKCEVEYLRGKIKLVHREVIDKDQFALTNATDRIIQLNDIFSPEHIYVDRGLGETQVELLKKHGIKYRYTGLADKVRGVAFQENVEIFDPATKLKVKKPVKAFMVENLRTFLEQEKIWFPDTDVALFKQLISYIVTISPSGNHKFEAGGTAEDHIHDALALACLAITENYGEFADVEVGTKARVVSLDPFLALANLSTNPDVYEDQIARAEEVYGSVSASPIQTRRKMTYTKRTGSRPIKRKMF